MKTFDYADAWRQLARPAFNALDDTLLELLRRVAVEARELQQGPDTAMRWPPDDGALRRAFDNVSTEALAWAARVVYYTGHWWPRNGRGAELPGREWGNHWKFSNYADQVLRERLKLSTNPDGGGYPGLTFQVHEGALRLCYSSHDSWTWAEVEPATVAGLASAEQLREKVRAALPSQALKKRSTPDVDAAAWRAFENLRGNHVATDPWRAWLESDKFMVEEGDQAPDPDAPPADVDGDKRRLIAKRTEAAEVKIEHLRTELAGEVWFIERGIAIDNLIYYDHMHGGLFSFGWRAPVGPELLSRILDVISEFGYPYRIKTHDGRTLEGNIG